MHSKAEPTNRFGEVHLLCPRQFEKLSLTCHACRRLQVAISLAAQDD
jgi:hypothetical protein